MSAFSVIEKGMDGLPHIEGLQTNPSAEIVRTADIKSRFESIQVIVAGNEGKVKVWVVGKVTGKRALLLANVTHKADQEWPLRVESYFKTFRADSVIAIGPEVGIILELNLPDIPIRSF